MVYQLSPKLQAYMLPQAYYFRYELGLKTAAFFGSAALGTALHQALAQVYRDWHYLEPIPELDWVHYCWHSQSLVLLKHRKERNSRNTTTTSLQVK